MSSSVQFSHSVMSDFLWPHEPQHTRPPCPSPTPRVYPNPCPLSRWCHPTISSSVIPFSCPQSFPASGAFQWVNSSHELAKVLEFQLQHQSFQNTQDWCPLGWTGWISLQSKGLSRVLSINIIEKRKCYKKYIARLSDGSEENMKVFPDWRKKIEFDMGFPLWYGEWRKNE